MSDALHDAAAEEAALIAALTNEAACDYVVGRLRESDFDGDKVAVFRAAAALRSEGRPVDAVTIGKALRNGGGGKRAAAYAAHLTELFVVTTNAPEYVESILEASARRRAATAAKSMAEVARSGDRADLAATIEGIAAEAAAEIRGRGGGEEQKSSLTAYALPELLERQPEAVEWVCYPYIAVGDVVSFESPPKDGKTTFVLALVHAISSSGHFLGERTATGPVLYCTEERVGTFLGALDRTGHGAGENLHVVLLHEAAWRMGWEQVAQEIARLAADTKARLVVIDTLSKWAGLHGDDEFSAGVAMTTITPLQHLASTGCAVAVIRHERKAGGAVGQAGRGSTAWTGEMDTVIAVRRIPGEKTQRSLEAIGRHDETPEERVIDFSSGEFTMLGDPGDLRRLGEERQIIDALNYGEAGALPINEIRGDVSRRTADRILTRLVQEGIVARGLGPSQRGGKANVYWLKEDE